MELALGFVLSAITATFLRVRIRELPWFLILGMAAILFSSIAHGSEITKEDLARGYVLVEKGQTLSMIGDAVGRNYHELAEINGIDDPDNISVGQKIWFRSPISDKERRRMARQAIWNRMVGIFRFRHARTYEFRNDSRSWAMSPFLDIDRSMRTPDIKTLMDESHVRLQWVDLVRIFKAISDVMEKDGVEAAFLQAAVAEQESNYRDVDGSHGEIGVCQIKPATGLPVLGEIDPKLTVEEAEHVLGDISWNIYVSRSLLEREEDKIRTLVMYNGGSEKWEYSSEVMRRYYQIKDEFLGILEKEKS